MKTKEYIKLKSDMITFIEEFPLSIKTLDALLSYIESMSIVNTLIASSFLLDKELGKLSSIDKVNIDKSEKRLEMVISKIELYLLKHNKMLV